MVFCIQCDVAERNGHNYEQENEPYPDTYFTFPVNSSQVKQKSGFAQRLEEDMEFRFRFFDAVANATAESRDFLEDSLRRAFMLTAGKMKDFADREDIAFNEEKLTGTINNLVREVCEKAISLFE